MQLKHERVPNISLDKLQKLATAGEISSIVVGRTGGKLLVSYQLKSRLLVRYYGTLSDDAALRLKAEGIRDIVFGNTANVCT